MNTLTKLQTVYIHSSCRCIDSEYAEEEYGDWSEQYEFTLDKASLSGHSGDDDFPVNPVKLGDDIWVLYLTYSDGDSFGSADGKGLIIWAFADASVAKQALADCERAIETENQSFVFSSDAGKTITTGNPTSDYFTNGYVSLTRLKLES